jgi:hypothetical protein
MGKVTISCGNNGMMAAEVADCSVHGLKVHIRNPLSAFASLQKTSKIMVQFPDDQVWLLGLCVYVAEETDGIASMGIYFYHPNEQNYLQERLYKSLKEGLSLSPVTSHEWEEAVDKLITSR